MPIRKLNPRSPGVRFKTISGYDEVTKDRPEKSLLVYIPRTGGRNNHGRLTTKCRGGGHRKLYRVIDFRRDKDGIEARVAGVEYDPNRNAYIALLNYKDGEKRYILAPSGLKDGDTVVSGPNAEIRTGNCLPLSSIPDGTFVHNIELRPGKGGQMARSAGAYAQLMAKEGPHATLKLGSGEVRLVDKRCRATVGSVGNADFENLSMGKAGRNRWKGFRPRVRAVAMNPVDHPMGGGEGKTSGGRHPCNASGFPAKGAKTRKRKKQSSKFIVSRRKK
ncbi:MAG: 50S ribosomal protein L2 [Nitrospinae bacterium]|nr:50S ribosomal protein L2 [Nitrospinota bacterium]